MRNLKRFALCVIAVLAQVVLVGLLAGCSERSTPPSRQLRDIRDRPQKYAGKFITLDVWLLNVLTRDRWLVVMDWPTDPRDWKDADSPRFPREIYYVRYDSSQEAEVLNRASPPGYKIVRIKLEVTEQIAEALTKCRRNQGVSGKSSLSEISVGRLVEFLPTIVDEARRLLPEVSPYCVLFGSALYAANYIEVKDIVIKPGKFPYHRTLCVHGGVRNSGNQRLRTVWIKIYYLNRDGDPIYEQTHMVTHPQAYLLGKLDPNKIIKPGYEAKFSCPTGDVPSGWNGGVVIVPIDVDVVR